MGSSTAYGAEVNSAQGSHIRKQVGHCSAASALFWIVRVGASTDGIRRYLLILKGDAIIFMDLKSSLASGLKHVKAVIRDALALNGLFDGRVLQKINQYARSTYLEYFLKIQPKLVCGYFLRTK